MVVGQITGPMTKVPLTEASRCITGILKHLGHGILGRVQGFGFVRKTYSTIHSHTLGVATGQKCRSRRRTILRGIIEVSELKTLRLSLIHI